MQPAKDRIDTDGIRFSAAMARIWTWVFKIGERRIGNDATSALRGHRLSRSNKCGPQAALPASAWVESIAGVLEARRCRRNRHVEPGNGTPKPFYGFEARSLLALGLQRPLLTEIGSPASVFVQGSNWPILEVSIGRYEDFHLADI